MVLYEVQTWCTIYYILCIIILSALCSQDEGAVSPGDNVAAVVDTSLTPVTQGPNLERLWGYLCPLTKGTTFRV